MTPIYNNKNTPNGGSNFTEMTAHLKLSIIATTIVLCSLLPVASLASEAPDESVVTDASNYGVVVCRVAKTGENVNARMVNQPLALVCKPLDPTAKMATIGTVVAQAPRMAPDLTGALTTEQLNAAWTRYINKLIMIDRTP